MRVGLPILANTAAFGAVLSLDRVLILWRVPDGDRAAGLYTIAIMGTSWSLDLAGRIVLVHVHVRSRRRWAGPATPPRSPGRRSGRPRRRRPCSLAGRRRGVPGRPGVPRGADAPIRRRACPRLRPLLPGMILLGLAWPARQMLIAVGRPYRSAWPRSPAWPSTAAGRRGRGRPGGDRRRGLGDDGRLRRRRLADQRRGLRPGPGLAALVGPSGRLARTLLGFGAGRPSRPTCRSGHRADGPSSPPAA